MSHLTVGLISVGLGLWGMASWWSVFGLVMRGVIPFALLVFGLVAILAACRRIGLVAAEAGPGHTRARVHPDDRHQDNDEHQADDLHQADDILGT